MSKKFVQPGQTMRVPSQPQQAPRVQSTGVLSPQNIAMAKHALPRIFAIICVPGIVLGVLFSMIAIALGAQLPISSTDPDADTAKVALTKAEEKQEEEAPVEGEAAKKPTQDEAEGAATNEEEQIAILEFTDVQWSVDQQEQWDGRVVPFLHFSATITNKANRHIGTTEMPVLRVGEKEYRLKVETHPFAGDLDANESSAVSIETALEAEGVDPQQFAFVPKSDEVQLAGVDGLAEAISTACVERVAAIQEAQRVAEEERQRQEAEEQQRREAEEEARKQQEEEDRQRREAEREAEVQRRREAVQQTYTAPAQQDAQGDVVYITNTGTKYHRDGCRHLQESKTPISRADAISQGYEPCSQCRP